MSFISSNSKELTENQALPIFAVCWIGWKLVKKTRVIPLAEIDFHSGRRELDELEALDEERFKAETKYQKIISILF